MTETTNAVELLEGLVGDDPELRRIIAEERVHLKVAELIYEARTKANLTQKELAVKVNSSQSAIARLEDADYHGHSLNIISRIADALGLELDIQLRPIGQRQHEQPTIWKNPMISAASCTKFNGIYGPKSVPGLSNVPERFAI